MGAPMLLTVGLSGTFSLCILGSPYNVGGLEPAGHSYRRVSSVIDAFFQQCSGFPFYCGILGEFSISWVLKKGRNLLFVV